MKRAGRLLALGATLLLIGCYRTKYINLMRQSAFNPPRVASDAPKPQPHSSWQHFFIWGWVPSVRVIPAGDICGGPEYVKEIRTERAFVQGLIAQFAGYFINLYSPYTGDVVCTQEPPRE